MPLTYNRLARFAAWLPLCALLAVASCKPIYDDPEPVNSPESVQGWAPIYDSNNQSKIIRSIAPQDIANGGRIYIKDTLLFQVETGKGIHVIDLSDKQHPVKLSFLEIKGCQELAVMDHILYTNNLNDLVAIDIQNVNQLQLKDRISNAFHIFNAYAPPTSGWYECVDNSKGAVVGWEMKTLNYPKCR